VTARGLQGMANDPYLDTRLHESLNELIIATNLAYEYKDEARAFALS
jgi:hypothetical protein